MNELTKAQESELESLEKIVDRYFESRMEAGIALLKLRDNKLYLKRFDTFEEYCKTRWNFTRQRAYQLIDAASVVKELPPQMSTMVDNERKARELGKVPTGKRAGVVRRAAAGGRRVTASAIAEAAKAETKDAPELCETGVEIPKDILPLWHRMKEAQEVVTSISRIKSTLKKAQDEDDPLWREVDHNRAIAELSGLFTHLSTGKPYAVCTVCHGVQPAREKCNYCRARGFISKFRYDTSATEKAKKFRKVK